MHKVGKIDIEKYKCVTDDITTDEVIITDEQIQHINENHSGSYEEIKPYLAVALAEPDYILEDKGHCNTGLILKEIKKDDKRFQIVLRLHTSADEENRKNSVISAWKISSSRWNNYLRNKKILYKSE